MILNAKFGFKLNHMALDVQLLKIVILLQMRLDVEFVVEKHSQIFNTSMNY